MVVAELLSNTLVLILHIIMSDSPSNVDTQNGAEDTYPTQRHAGNVGYGPNYTTGPVRTSREIRNR
jgi:hypothetical protein